MTKRYSSDPKQRAAELVAEGKIGGKRKGAGRPRKPTSDSQRKRASTVIAERAREVAPQMAAALVDVLLADDATRTEKMRAVKVLTGIEGVETDRERDELAELPFLPPLSGVSWDRQRRRRRGDQLAARAQGFDGHPPRLYRGGHHRRAQRQTARPSRGSDGIDARRSRGQHWGQQRNR